ncbi:Peptidase S24/S26A/S26B/S26C [Oxalobacteraceae bacterium]
MSDLSVNLNDTARAAAELPVAGIYSRISLDDLLIPHPSKTLLIRCPNDSQAAQGLHKGDLLVVDQSQPPRVGQWVIKVTNDEVSILQIVNESIHTSHSDSEILGAITYRIGKLP